MRLGRAVLSHIWDRGSNTPIQFGSKSLKRPSPPPSPSSFKRSKLELLAPFVTSVPSIDNPIPSLEIMSNEGDIDGGVEMFLFTDNSTAEWAFYKGSSSSKLLFNLILRLRKLEMQVQCKLNLIHVSPGKRMIAQSSDGLSRGDFSEGVMKGVVDMKKFIPLHLSAIDRSKQLKGWQKSWTGNSKLEWLSAEGWFTRGHNLVEEGFERNVDGISIPTYKKDEFVWTPAPAAAEACLEELRKARHKHQDSSHIILIPRLMSPFWRRHLNKVCDFVFELPLGKLTVWKEDMFELQTIGLVLPYLSHRPWQLKQSPVLVGLQKQLRKVWESDPVSSGPTILRQLWDLPGHLGSMSEFHIELPERDVSESLWGRKEDLKRFQVARKGDSLSAPFQCDFCWFTNLTKRVAERNSSPDTRLLGYIRRVNLDVMWSREPSTVGNTMRSMVNKARKLSGELGLEPIDVATGPWPVVGDQVGFQLAIIMLRASQEKGRNSRDYVQYNLIRKLRSAFSTVHKNSASAARDVDVFKGDMGQTFGVRNSNSDSYYFFRKFCKGLEKRMGRLVIQNLGIGTDLMRILLNMLEEEELNEAKLSSVRNQEGNYYARSRVHLLVCSSSPKRQ